MVTATQQVEIKFPIKLNMFSGSSYHLTILSSNLTHQQHKAKVTSLPHTQLKEV
jgi:hypothetical protein